jgi:hypothetical protein
MKSLVMFIPNAQLERISDATAIGSVLFFFQPHIAKGIHAIKESPAHTAKIHQITIAINLSSYEIVLSY